MIVLVLIVIAPSTTLADDAVPPSIVSNYHTTPVTIDNPVGLSEFSEHCEIAWDGSTTSNRSGTKKAMNLAEKSDGNQDGTISGGLTVNATTLYASGATYFDGTDDKITFTNIEEMAEGTVHINYYHHRLKSGERPFSTTTGPLLYMSATSTAQVVFTGGAGLPQNTGTASVPFPCPLGYNDIIVTWNATALAVYQNGCKILSYSGLTLPITNNTWLLGQSVSTYSPQITVGAFHVLNSRITDDEAEAIYWSTVSAYIPACLPWEYVPSANEGTWDLKTNASWLSMTSSGHISGTPLEIGDWWANITVINELGEAYQNLTIRSHRTDAPTIAPVPHSFYPYSRNNIVQDYSYVAPHTSDQPVTWSLITDAEWLEIDTDGTICGTPPEDGRFTYTIVATNVNGETTTSGYIVVETSVTQATTNAIAPLIGLFVAVALIGAVTTMFNRIKPK